MNHDTFRQTFEDRNFDVRQYEEPPEGKDLGVLIAENKNGDQIYWSMLIDENVWGLYFDLQKFTLDDADFRWEEVDFTETAVVLEGVTGTRSKEYGYGRVGFQGEITVDWNGSQLKEVRTY